MVGGINKKKKKEEMVGGINKTKKSIKKKKRRNSFCLMEPDIFSKDEFKKKLQMFKIQPSRTKNLDE